MLQICDLKFHLDENNIIPNKQSTKIAEKAYILHLVHVFFSKFKINYIFFGRVWFAKVLLWGALHHTLSLKLQFQPVIVENSIRHCDSEIVQLAKLIAQRSVKSRIFVVL